MIVRLIDFWAQRSARERRMIAIMLAIAVPLLLWLLIAGPVTAALTEAKDRQAEAVARHGRIVARIDAIERGGAPDAARPRIGALDLFVAEAASQRGLTIDSNVAQGPDAVAIGIAHARPEAIVDWLAEFERQGIVIEDMTMTANPDASIALDARLSRSGT
ncbi:MAG: type II secretion system protein M [Sphingomonadales bacterium]|nr:type II secretion system protein M [Sphingomonadales bacterium]